MPQLLLLSLIMLLIPSMILMMNMLISTKKITNQEKLTPFECGFDPLSLNRLPFSIQFFLISLIFLIFDIEIALLIPLISLMFMFSFTSMILSLFFLSILVMGLYFEYIEKSIEWKN